MQKIIKNKTTFCRIRLRLAAVWLVRKTKYYLNNQRYKYTKIH